MIAILVLLSSFGILSKDSKNVLQAVATMPELTPAWLTSIKKQ